MFFAQNQFSWQNCQLLLIHTIHILEAIVPAVNLAYLGTLYVHPVICPKVPRLGFCWAGMVLESESVLVLESESPQTRFLVLDPKLKLAHQTPLINLLLQMSCDEYC